MNLQEVIKPAYICTDMQSGDRDNALRELIEAAMKTGHVTNSAILFGDLLAREDAFTTKIMAKIAIPHAKSQSVTEPMVFIGKSKQGISWNSDGMEAAPEDRVYLIFLILVPGESESNDHLKLLATLARCLSHESFRNQIHDTDDKDEILAAIGAKMEEINNR